MTEEEKASICHNIWSHWMKHLLPMIKDGTILRSDLERWERQMNTSYKDLSEEEKISDIKVAEMFFKQEGLRLIMEDRFKFKFVVEANGVKFITREYNLLKDNCEEDRVIENLGGEYEEEAQDLIFNYGKIEKVLQCTGLKDVNGTLIYEGDIIKLTYKDGSESTRLVYYKHCSFQFKDMEKGSRQIDKPLYCYSSDYLGHFGEDEIEIIGNIHTKKES